MTWPSEAMVKWNVILEETLRKQAKASKDHKSKFLNDKNKKATRGLHSQELLGSNMLFLKRSEA